MSVKRVRVRVSGRVQGVWYRGWVQDQAARLGVNGWVRNLADGDVEGVFEGPPAAVDRLVAVCKDGPPAARVHEVRAAEEAPEGLADFQVRR